MEYTSIEKLRIINFKMGVYYLGLKKFHNEQKLENLTKVELIELLVKAGELLIDNNNLLNEVLKDEL